MAGPDRTRSSDPDELRRTAERILEADKFHERSVPRPFRGVMRWIGERLRALYEPIESVLAPIVGADAAPWVVLAASVLLVGFVTHRLVRARSRAEAVRRTKEALRLDPATDPDELDAEADRAEAAGNHARAVRARHRAGLVRLARDGHLDLRPDTTARAAAVTVDHPRLDELTDRFEAIVYGGSHAGAADSRAFRRRWAEVLDDHGRRRTPRTNRTTEADR